MISRKKRYKKIIFGFFNLLFRKEVILFSILLLHTPALPQVTDVEILKKNLATTTNDTLRADMLNLLGRHYAGMDNKLGLKYLNESSEISQKLNYRKGIAYSYLYLGRVHYYSDDFQSSFNYYYKAYPIFIETRDMQGLAEYFFFLGELNRLLGDYEVSIENYQEAIKIQEELGESGTIAACFNSIGKVHSDQKNFTMAIEYYNEALRLHSENENLQGVGTVLNNIGGLYELKNNTDLALDYYEQSLDIRLKIGEQRRIANSRQRIGELQCKSGMYPQAEESFKQVLATYELLKDQTGISIANLSLARLYLRSGNSADADAHARTALQIAGITHNDNLKAACLNLLSKVSASQGYFEEAYNLHLEYKQIADSIFAIENERSIADLEVKYQIAKKDQMISQLDNQNKIQEQRVTMLTVSIFAVVLLLILLIGLLRYRNLSLKQKYILLESEGQVQRKEAELKQKEHALLHEKLENQNKDLISKVLLINKNNEKISNILEALKTLKLSVGDGNGKIKRKIDDILRNLEYQASESLWEDFERSFKDLHSSFYTNLLERCPDLTPTEIKTAALLRLNMTTKEIEAITFKSESSIKSVRFRLRKKLGLENDDNLIAFLMKL
jgi:tetratricopeptide (TPR) repeat protein